MTRDSRTPPPTPAAGEGPPDSQGTAQSNASSPADTYWVLEADLRPESEELWGLFCFEQGALGAEEVEAPGALRRVRHMFGTEPPSAGWAATFAAAYPDVPPPERLELRRQAVEPWETAWRAHFTPLRVGRRLLVTPPWETPPVQADPGEAASVSGARLRIVIDPGQGFGTGWHPSTALALEALEAALTGDPAAGTPPLRPDTLVDVGTGSGILAIAGRLLGVPRAIALDIDAPALPEVRRNFQLSGLPPPDAVLLGGPECVRGTHGLVIANIIAEVLLAHASALAGLTAPGGCLILSGILAGERASVLDAYDRLGLALAAEHARDGWVALRLRRG